MIMKKTVILTCFVLLLLTSCNFDPFSEQRPPDLGDAIWMCDEYDIWFVVDSKKDDYYAPEGEMQIHNTTFFCKFYFIHQTNQLHINVYPLEYATIPDTSRDRSAVVGNIEGECTFSKESFVFTIDTTSGNVLDETVEKLTFQKTSIPFE